MCIIFFPVDAKAMLKTKGAGGGGVKLVNREAGV